MNTKPSIKKNVILNTMYQILMLIVPFITAPYVSRVLGADGIGVYSYTGSIQMFFSMFAVLGTLSYGEREISRARNEIERRSQLFWEIEFLSVVTTTICLVLWFVWIAITDKYQVCYLVLTMGLLSSLFDISWFYAGLEQFSYTVLTNTFFRILGVVLLFIFIRDSGDVVLYIALSAASAMLGSLSMWIYLPKFIKKPKVNLNNMKIHFKETLVYFVPTIASSIYTVLDKTLLGLITKDAGENGYYEQATKIINMAKSVTFTALNTVMGARTAFLFAEGEYEEIRQRIKKSIDYIMFMGIGMCFGIIGVAREFVPLFFGPGYDKTIIIMQLLSPVILIIGISNCIGSLYYTPAGLRAKSAKFLIVGSIVNLIMNIILIPHYKSVGAVLATIVAELVITILYTSNARDYFKVSWLLQRTWKKLIAGIIMLIFILGVDYFITGIGAIICEVIGGIVVYFIVLLIMKDSFLNYIIDTFMKRRN